MNEYWEKLGEKKEMNTKHPSVDCDPDTAIHDITRVFFLHMYSFWSLSYHYHIITSAWLCSSSSSSSSSSLPAPTTTQTYTHLQQLDSPSNRMHILFFCVSVLLVFGPVCVKIVVRQVEGRRALQLMATNGKTILWSSVPNRRPELTVKVKWGQVLGGDDVRSRWQHLTYVRNWIFGFSEFGEYVIRQICIKYGI